MDPFHHDAYFTNLMHDGIHLNDEVIDQSSPISPQVDSTTKKQRGGNFTSEEDIMIISAWLNISWMLCKEMRKNLRHIGKGFASTSTNTNLSHALFVVKIL